MLKFFVVDSVIVYMYEYEERRKLGTIWSFSGYRKGTLLADGNDKIVQD